MKNQIFLLRFLLTVILTLSVSINVITGQGKVRITTGFGVPEFINAGMKVRLGQSEAGFCAGFFPSGEESFLFDWERVFSAGGDYYIHFAGKSTYTDLRPFYLRAGVSYVYIKWDATDIDNLFSTQLRIGRDFYFSSKLGIGIDAGVVWHLNDVDSTWGSRIGWGAGVNLFFRI